ncbi:MAG: DUF6424 family protein [Actinomycetota bacterium]|nr:DUF6424 family protein [Actinomycetota bacterium]
MPEEAEDGTHTRGESLEWEINVPDHAGRTESSTFRKAKRVARKIMATLEGREPFGPGPWHMHHGGSLWVFSEGEWKLFFNTIGIEWSAQFCADPTKVDRLRMNAKSLYDAFPMSIPEMERLGLTNARRQLETPITDPATVGVWVDSVFNSCVPLHARHHTAVLPKGGGRHHYPAPITDIDLIKFDDFELWVTDEKTGTRLAVVPVSPRGSGDGRVTLTFAPPDHPLAEQKQAAARHGERVIFAPDSPLAHQAYIHQ